MTRETAPQPLGISGQSEEARQRNLQSGRDLKDSLPFFPDSRKCRDVVWVILFGLMITAVIYGCVAQTRLDPASVAVSDSEGMKLAVRRLGPKIDNIAAPVLGSVFGSMFCGIFVSIAFIFALKTCTEPVIRATMWMTPMIYLGIAALFFWLQFSNTTTGYSGDVASDVGDYGFAISGAIFVLLALCACCLMRRWEKYIPFTVSVVAAVMEVMSLHPGLFVVAIVGVLLATVWNSVCLYLICVTANLATEYMALEIIGAVFAMYWGSMVWMNVTAVAYAGVFGRWYFNKQGRSTLPSLIVGFTTSFGSVCFGSFFVAIVRTLEYLARSCRRSDNVVVCIVGTIITCILACIGDTIEYFNSWAYVQCAVRNASFCQAAKITYSMATFANLRLIISELLLGWVAGVGTLVSSIFGAAIGIAIGFVLSQDSKNDERQAILAIGGVCGFVSALIVGSAINDIMATGTKSILVLWAEDKQPFQHSHPELSLAFDQKLRTGLLA